MDELKRLIGFGIGMMAGLFLAVVLGINPFPSVSWACKTQMTGIIGATVFMIVCGGVGLKVFCTYEK
jgi:hypothetical protein